MSAGDFSHVRYIDTHFHLDVCEDPPSVVKAVGRADVGAIVMTNAPFVFDASVDLARNMPQVSIAIGLHPQLAVKCGEQIHLFREKLSETRFVGEVGLDYQTRDAEERKVQRRVFGEILDVCSEHGGKILSVHSRLAAADVISMLSSGFRGTVIMHWFSGNVRELQQAERMGAFFSVNTAMLGSKRGRSLVSEIPMERVLTETDGPYVQTDGHPATPLDVTRSVAGLAAVWDCDPEVVRQQVMANTMDALANA